MPTHPPIPNATDLPRPLTDPTRSHGRVLVRPFAVVSPISFLLAMFAAFLLTVVTAPAAWAHPELISSTPPAGEKLAQPPSEIVLQFSEAVVRSVSRFEVDEADGSTIELTPSAERSAKVVLSLPAVQNPASIRVRWSLMGDDGHRIVGGITLSTAGGAIDPSTGGETPDPARSGASFAVFAGLIVATGVVVLHRWTAGEGTVGLRTRPWGRLLQLSFGTVAAGSIVSLLAIAASSPPDDTTAAPLANAFATRSGIVWWLTAMAALATAVVAGRIARAGPGDASHSPSERSSTNPFPIIVGGLILTGLGAVAAGHAGASETPFSSTTLSFTHLAGLALWLGPLVVCLGAIDRHDHDRAPGDRSARTSMSLRPPLMPPAVTSRLRGWLPAPFVVAIVSGFAMGLDRIEGPLLEAAYTRLLTAKTALLVAVIVPLALLHRRRHTMVGRRSMTLEVIAASVVLLLGAVLTTTAPPRPSTASDAPAEGTPGTGSGAPDSIDGCFDGPADIQSACLLRYFEAELRSSGPAHALAILAANQSRSDSIVVQCHQIAHELGRQSIAVTGDVAKAFEQGTAVCSSGYFHGIVESSLGALADNQLPEAVSKQCAAVPTEALRRFNCTHGLGHGLMIRLKGNLFASLQLCDKVEPASDVSACGGGAFMQNIMDALAGSASAVYDRSNLQYPCDIVPDRHKTACYQMAPSLMLFLTERSFAATFQGCEAAGEQWQSTCYAGIGREVASTTRRDPRATLDQCTTGPVDGVGHCINGAAADFVNELGTRETAEALCSMAPPEYTEPCRKGIAIYER